MRIAPGPTPRHPSPRTSPPSVVMRPELYHAPDRDGIVEAQGSPEQKKRLGGNIPSGSLEVLGRLEVPVEMAAMTSRSQAVEAGDLEQVGELLAGIEHPGLHRALGNPDDLAGFFHRFLMLIGEGGDLAGRGRQFGDA